ncbi:uncharacterized protein BP5553_01102 [Venustampulla echinocandica]|uniref:Transcription factor domain-containing protein n=1 Tax=Venustampulla echinocandica TaxID=2656787 RepID=A0A370U035_9HELO|nr:uncharacterized protein BP5553_01102 [Venustampulla echinocandica]RDL41123.1 hypothetical protein BP5553_01102 [Venustampulla echinocandica]
MNGGQEDDSANGNHSGNWNGNGNGRLGGFYAYRNTFNRNNVWVDVPKTGTYVNSRSNSTSSPKAFRSPEEQETNDPNSVTFCNVTDPFNMEPTPELECPPATASASTPIVAPQIEERASINYAHYDQAHGLEALSTIATSNIHYARPLPIPEQASLDATASPHSSNNLNFILNPAGPEGSASLASPPLDPALVVPISNSNKGNGPFPVEDPEVAFLLRHFGETTGQWMDLFDLGCYFAHHIPVLAISIPLLRHSACAYAAKQLGRVQGRQVTNNRIVVRPSNMEPYPHPETVDWSYIGAKYYDLAISLLMKELSNPGSLDVPMTPITSIEETFHQGSALSPQSILSSPANKRRRVSRPTPSSNADDTLAATAILCVYEFLDNANTAWSRHLNGTKTLFDLAEEEGMMPAWSPTSPGSLTPRIKPSRARKATFWNFARQDLLAAFINEGHTRLDTEDLGLWRAAGLHIDDQGLVIASNTEDSQFPERNLVMREDMISNALIWIMSKIVNFLASGDSVDSVFPQDRASPRGLTGLNQMVLLDRWRELEKELEIWHQGLPDTFRPCTHQLPIMDGTRSLDDPRSIFPEIWYSIPMCGSTMQSYHMARVILLLNKPQESTARRSTISNRLHSYRSIEAEVRDHSYKICGMALAGPEDSVRIHQVQPLFVAGQCLTEVRERHMILDLLRGIEADLGWATDYRVQQLLKEWGWLDEPS